MGQCRTIELDGIDEVSGFPKGELSKIAMTIRHAKAKSLRGKTEHERADIENSYKIIEDEFVDMLEKENPRFKEDKFREAASL